MRNKYQTTNLDKERFHINMTTGFSKIIKKSTNSSEIIIVSGLPRSGTSMMMKMLEATGFKILTDNFRTADENNPRGYYEFERVKKLKEGDFDWLPMARGKVVKIISALLEYLPNRYRYKIIFMSRNMDEVLASQHQMMVRNGQGGDQVADEKLAAVYENHLKKVNAWLEQQPNASVLYISYNQILQNPQPSINRINQFLGGKLDLKAMLQEIDQNLYRERRLG
jgi:hypothetical protein